MDDLSSGLSAIDAKYAKDAPVNDLDSGLAAIDAKYAPKPEKGIVDKAVDFVKNATQGAKLGGGGTDSLTEKGLLKQKIQTSTRKQQNGFAATPINSVMPEITKDSLVKSNSNILDYADDLTPKPKRSLGDYFGDEAVAVGKVVPTAVKGVVDIANLITQDKVDLGISKSLQNRMNILDKKYGSKALNYENNEFSKIANNEYQDIGDQANYLLENPTQLADKSITTIGSMFLPVGVTKGAISIASKALGNRFTPKMAETIASRSIAGTTALQNAADTFNDPDIAKLSLEDRNKAAAITMVGTLFGNKVFDGGLEKAIADKFNKTGAAHGFALVGKEAGQESTEDISQSLAKATVAPDSINFNQAAGSAVTSGLLGSVLGGSFTATQSRGQRIIETLKARKAAQEQAFANANSQTLNPNDAIQQSTAHPSTAINQDELLNQANQYTNNQAIDASHLLEDNNVSNANTNAELVAGNAGQPSNNAIGSSTDSLQATGSIQQEPSMDDSAKAFKQANASDMAMGVAGNEQNAPLDNPTPEPQATIQAQTNAFIAGNKPALLITTGESLPTNLPNDIKTADIPNRGTLIYRDDKSLQQALNGNMGEALGYGINEKPAQATGVVTARDEQGNVIQDVASDGRQSVIDAAQQVAGNGTVQTRPIEAAMAERQAGVKSQSAITSENGNQTETAPELAPVSPNVDNNQAVSLQSLPNALTINANDTPLIKGLKALKAKKIAKSKKSNTLLATLRNIGGISLGDKLDITGQDRAFAPGGYNQVFKQSARQSLTGHIENGSLDDYLPHNLRLTAGINANQAYDSTEAYDYLADKIRNGEKALPYEAQQELDAKKYDDKIDQDIVDTLTDDEINDQLQQASADERERATNARIFNTSDKNSSVETSAGTETSAKGRDGQAIQPTQVTQASVQNVQSQPASTEREGVRTLVTAIVKRRAAAQQMGKEKLFDERLQLAKDFMVGKEVSSKRLLDSTLAFKNDPPLAEAFKALHTLAKQNNNELNKKDTIAAYKQRIGEAKTINALQTIAGQIQRDNNLTDKQATYLDDAVFEAQDALEGSSQSETEKSPETAPVKADVKSVETVLQGVEAANWQRLNQDDSRVYVNSEGTKLRTYEKDGVRIALRPNHSLNTERNSAIVYNDPDSGNVIIEAILVDDNVRKQGKATKTIQLLNSLADKTNSILYIEPVPLLDKAMSKNELVALYAKNGFVAQSDANKVMVRKPNQKTTDLLGDNTQSKQAIADAEQSKDAKRNTGNDNADSFNLTGSNSEADKAAGAGAQALFSQRTNKGKLTIADVEAVITNDTYNHKIDVYQSMAEAPIYIQVQAKSEGASWIEGYFDGRTNRVALIANNLPNAKRAIEVARHELIGHYGLENMLNKVDATLLPKLLKSVLFAEKAGNKAIVEIAKYVDETQAGLNDKRRAKEIIAVMAERNIHNKIMQRVIDAVRLFLKKIGFTKGDVTDAKIAGLLRDAQLYLKANGRSVVNSSDMVGVFSNQSSDKKNAEFAIEVAKELAEFDDAFRYNVSKSSTLEGNLKTALPSAKHLGDSTRADEKQESGADKRTLFKTALGQDFYVFERGNNVWIDVSRLKVGSQGGAIYHGVANYAFNTNKKFVGDPAGLSEDAIVRRTSAMLSSALRFGTLRHFEATEQQINVPANSDVKPLDWTGSDLDKTKSLMASFLDNIARNFPQIKEYKYDFETRKFVDSLGKSVDGSRLELGRSKGVFQTSRAGEASIRRGIFLMSLASSESSQRPAILEQFFSGAKLLASTPELKALFSNNPTPPTGGVFTSKAQAPLTPDFEIPQTSKLDNVLRSVQDKNIDLKRVIANIKKAVGDISDNINAYLQEELYHGRAAKRTHDFLNNELNPLITAMQTRNVSMADLEEYLWARHAEERNIQIAKVNPDMPDGGSGLTTKEASDYLNSLSAGQTRNFDALAKRVDAITKGSRQVLVDYNLESAGTVLAMESAYKNYVPLMREDMDMGFGLGTGQGFSVKGNSGKRATGSKRAVVDILANIAQQRERNIIRGEKNRVSTALVGLAKLNPNADFWEVDTPPRITGINKVTGLVEENADPNYKNRNNVVIARIADKNGNIQERSVVFNERNERAVQMALSLKNLDQDHLGAFFSTSAVITRYFASINTQYNPMFGVVNIIRDVQGALLNLSSTALKGKQLKILAETAKTIVPLYKELRALQKNGQSTNSDMARLYEDFGQEGGKTGYQDMFRNASERSKAIEKTLDPTWWQKTKLGKVVTANGVLATPEQWLTDKAVKPLFDWLSDYNEALENTTRLATYKVGLEQGLSKQQAASIAKNISVNFNRKGNVSSQVGSLYAFFNASVQGTARIAETLTTNDNGKISISKAGAKIITGGLLLGAMQALAFAIAGFDDEEPPEFIRDRNIVIPTSSGKYIAIPMPLGFNAIPAFGRIVTEWALGGGKDTGKHVVHIMDMLLDATNPIGNAGLSMQTVAPTLLDPVAALTENKDFAGRPIARKDFNSKNPTPGYTRAKDTASSIGTGLAYFINSASGGNAYRKGQLSPTPDQIDYLIGQAAGGVGREGLKIQEAIKSVATGEELPNYKIPLVGKFYGNAKNKDAERGAYYNNVVMLNELESELKGRRENKDGVEEFKSAHPLYKLIMLGNQTEKSIAALTKQKKRLQDANASQDRLKLTNELIDRKMKLLNDDIRKIQAE